MNSINSHNFVARHILSPDLTTPIGNGYEPYGSSNKKICYVTSTNGYSWNTTPTCPVNTFGIPYTTRADQVTASFDAYRKVFVVTWVASTDYLIRMLTIPGTGSAQAVTVYSTFGHYSHEAPTVSCRRTQSGCTMVFMAYAPTAYLKTLNGDITTGGTWSTTDNWSDFYDLDQSATPSIAYRSYDDSFVLAYLKRDMKSIRTYRRTWGDTVHWSSPVTAATVTTSMSAPSLGTWQHAQQTSEFVLTYLDYGL